MRECVSVSGDTHYYAGPDGVKRGMMKGGLCSPSLSTHGPQTDTVGTRVRTYVCRVRACVHVRRMWLALGAVWTGFVRWSLPFTRRQARELMVNIKRLNFPGANISGTRTSSRGHG